MTNRRANGHNPPVNSDRHQWLRLVIQACEQVAAEARAKSSDDAKAMAEGADELRARFQAELDAEESTA